MATADTTKTMEAKAAELLSRMDSFLGDDGTFAAMQGTLGALSRDVEELKGVDHKKTYEELEKLRAGFERIENAIRTSRQGVYIPGLEEEGKKSLNIRGICRAIATGKWDGYEREKAIVMEATEKWKLQQVGDDTMGGFFVPNQVIADVIGQIYTRSVWVNLAGTEGSTNVSLLNGLIGGKVTIPKFLGGMSAGWIGELDQFPETAATFGEVTLTPKKLAAFFRMTDTMMRMGSYGFEGLLRRDLSEAFAAEIDRVIPFGVGGDHEPRGLIRMPNVKLFPIVASAGSKVATTIGAAKAAGITLTGGALHWDWVEAMNLALEEDNITPEGPMITSPRTISYLKQLRYETHGSSALTAGSPTPYFVGAPMLSDARLADIIGPFAKSNRIPSNSNPGLGSIPATDATNDGKVSAIFKGSLREILFGQWGGIEFSSDAGNGLGFTKDQTYFKARMYSDVGARQERAIIVCLDAVVR